MESRKGIMEATKQTGMDKVAKQMTNLDESPIENVYFTPKGWGAYRQILGWIHGLAEAAPQEGPEADYAEKIAHDWFWTLENLARDSESRLVVASDSGYGGDWRDFSFSLWRKTKSKPPADWTYDDEKPTLDYFVHGSALVGNRYSRTGGTKVYTPPAKTGEGGGELSHFVAWMNGGIVYRGSRTSDPMSVLIGQNSRMWSTHT
jgi:hypothetical protein